LGIVRGQHIPVYNRESKSAQKLGYALRLAAGFPRDDPKKKKNSPQPPDAIAYQIDKVPRSMLGAGFQNMPKEVTLAFLCGTGAIELDIEASHQQAILLRYPHMKLPTLEKLVQDPPRIPQRHRSENGSQLRGGQKAAAGHELPGRRQQAAAEERRPIGTAA
jgi:hypothetical protein